MTPWLGYKDGEAVAVYTTAADLVKGAGDPSVDRIAACLTYEDLKTADTLLAAAEGLSGLAMYAKANAS